MILELISAEVDPSGADQSGGEMLRLVTSVGKIRCRLHRADDGNAPTVVWGFGAGGGLGGPAGGVYERLAAALRPRGVASLQIDYRFPGDLKRCVLDVFAGIAYLEKASIAAPGRLALVGHSFGGAVMIAAGALHPSVAAVAALSSQTFGTDMVAEIAPKPLLLVHGEADEVLPLSCSRDIYSRAREPKHLILYPGCRHGLDECRDAVERDLNGWLEQALRLPPSIVR